MKSITKILSLFLILVTLTACENQEDKIMDPNLFTVAPNAQLTYETLRIGFGAVESGDYLDKEGIEVSGNFVYIWPFLKGEEKGRPSMLVYEGLTVEIENYLVEIIEIKKGEIQVRILTKNASE